MRFIPNIWHSLLIKLPICPQIFYFFNSTLSERLIHSRNISVCPHVMEKLQIFHSISAGKSTPNHADSGPFFVCKFTTVDF